jgi:dTDP-glucose pyrophosphorylase
MSDRSTTSTPAWKLALLPIESTIQDAVQNLDCSGLQIIIAVAPDGTLIGTLTDGDIRRGLLGGLKLSSRIDSIVHRDPLVVPPEWSRELVLPLMQANKIHQIPVVDAHHNVVGLHTWSELLMPVVRSNMIVIMAGGRGTRLQPHTEHCPKPMLSVYGKPILEHIVDRAKLQGFQHLVLAVCYLGHMIEEYFGDGSRWGVRIEYLREQSPLGTAGALGLIEARPNEPFIVTNGDVLTDVNYGDVLDFHNRYEAMATMAVRQYEWQNPFGVVTTNGVDITGFDEKPVTRSHINAGIYALEPQVLDFIASREPCDMPALFGRLQEKAQRTVAYAVHEPWLDVGRPTDLEQARGARPSQQTGMPPTDKETR